MFDDLGIGKKYGSFDHALGQAYSQSKRWRLLVDARCCSLG